MSFIWVLFRFCLNFNEKKSENVPFDFTNTEKKHIFISMVFITYTFKTKIKIASNNKHDVKQPDNWIQEQPVYLGQTGEQELSTAKSPHS